MIKHEVLTDWMDAYHIKVQEYEWRNEGYASVQSMLPLISFNQD